MKMSTSALLLFALATPLHAQESIAPGSPLLKPERIRANTDTFTIVSYRNGQVAFQSNLVRTTERIVENGRAMIRFAQRYTGADGSTVDTSWVDAKTLAPIRYQATLTNELQQFTFDGLKANGTVTAKDSARTVAHTGTEPFFNAVPFDGIMYAALSLQEGSDLKALAYNPPRMFLPMTIKFAGREDVTRIDGSTVRAIVLTQQTGPAPARIWIDAETGALLKLGFGSGANAFWKVRAGIPVPPAA